MEDSIAARDGARTKPLRLARFGGHGEFALLTVLAMAFPLAWWIGWTLAGRGYAFNDYHDYWLGAKLVADGRSPYDLDAIRVLAAASGLHFVVGTGYSYPLPFALFMVPFSMLPFTTSVLSFNAVSLIVFGVAVAGWVQWAHPARLTSVDRRAVLAFAAGTFPPVYGTIANGQANLLLLGPLALGTALVVGGARAHAVLGGFAIGLVTIVKLTSGLFLVPLALGRRIGAVVGLLAGALGSLALATFAAPWAGEGSAGLSSLFATDSYFTNQSINGFISRLVRPSDRTLPIWPNAFEPSPVVLVLTAGFGVATALVLWRARGALAGRRGLALGLALALVAGLIGAPKGTYWNQAFALVPVGLLLAVEARDLRVRRLGLVHLALLGVWFAGTAIQTALWVEPPGKGGSLAPVVTLLQSSSIYGLVALWLLLAWRLLGTPARPVADDGPDMDL